MLQEGKGGDRTQKVTIKSPPKMFYVGKKLFTFFLKNGIFKAFFEAFYLDPGKKIPGASKGINKVSCRRVIMVPFPSMPTYGHNDQELT